MNETMEAVCKSLNTNYGCYDKHKLVNVMFHIHKQCMQEGDVNYTNFSDICVTKLPCAMVMLTGELPHRVAIVHINVNAS